MMSAQDYHAFRQQLAADYAPLRTVSNEEARQVLSVRGSFHPNP